MTIKLMIKMKKHEKKILHLTKIIYLKIYLCYSVWFCITDVLQTDFFQNEIISAKQYLCINEINI